MYSWVKLTDLAKWSQGRFQNQAAGLLVKSISTDSRTVKPGEVFVALRGEKFDGHDYALETIQKGAAAVITHKELVGATVPVIIVDDPLKAMVRIGREMRQLFKGPVFAITGSAGKSTTKETLGTLLGSNTLISPASFNNLTGVSRTLCLLEDQTQRLVLEMGMNNFGEIKELCEEFMPVGGAITNIGDAHIGKLGGREGIYKAKKELFDYLATAKEMIGIALNLDDPMVVKAYGAAFNKPVKTISYSAAGEKADVQVKDARVNPKTGGLSFTLSWKEKSTNAELALYGLHHAQNIAAASAAALLLGVQWDEVSERLRSLKPASHRGEFLNLAGGRTLIDESYNSNPTALTSSLRTLAQLNPARHRLLVIGEMRELDQFSQELHQKVGQELAKVFKGQPVELVAVGEGTTPLVKAAAATLTDQRCHQVADWGQAKDLAQKLFTENSICLVKGSRGIQLDKVVAHLQTAFR